MKKNNVKKLFITGLAAMSLFCMASLSFAEEDDADALKEQISAIDAEIEQLESERADLQAQVDELEGTDEAGEADQQTGGDVEVLEEYTYQRGSYSDHFLVVKNNTDKDVKVTSESFAYGEDGTMVGFGDGYLDALAPGCTSVFYELIETDEEIASYDTTVTAGDSGYYVAVNQDLSYEQTDVSGGAVFQITNNGEYAADFVQGYALFLLDGEMVDYEYSYFTDDDSEIKPGDTISKQLSTNKEFDTMEFYMIGRRHAD